VGFYVPADLASAAATPSYVCFRHVPTKVRTGATVQLTCNAYPTGSDCIIKLPKVATDTKPSEDDCKIYFSKDCIIAEGSSNTPNTVNASDLSFEE
jgi:hypothetical protein